MIYDWFNDLARVLRVNIMAYDYSGYGKSIAGNSGNGRGASYRNGQQASYAPSPARAQSRSHSRSRNEPLQPCEDYVYADIEAAYDYLLNERSIQPSEIVLYGRSLGSGPTCYLASKTASRGPQHSVAGVILQSPLLSAFRVAFNFRFTMVWDKFPNIDYAPRIQCPVFIVHGTQDEVVPFWHGQDLWLSLEQQWRAKPFWVEGAGHNNIEALLRPSGAFVDKLIEFLDLHIAAREKNPNNATENGRGGGRAPRTVPECVNDSLNASASRHNHASANSNNTRTTTNPNAQSPRLMATSSHSHNQVGHERSQTPGHGNVDANRGLQGRNWQEDNIV